MGTAMRRWGWTGEMPMPCKLSGVVLLGLFELGFGLGVHRPERRFTKSQNGGNEEHWAGEAGSAEVGDMGLDLLHNHGEQESEEGEDHQLMNAGDKPSHDRGPFFRLSGVDC